jgi:GTPase SAR1 family protein
LAEFSVKVNLIGRSSVFMFFSGVFQYCVAMLGATGVGKSALTRQFLSSDHMATYEDETAGEECLSRVEKSEKMCESFTYLSLCHLSAELGVRKAVSVSLDGSESALVFIDHAHTDMAVRNGWRFSNISRSLT